MSKLKSNRLFKMIGFRGGKKEVSYVDLHNSAVIRYRRACRTFIWAGIINFVGLIIGIIQHYTQEAQADNPIPFYFCFGTCDFLFTWFETFPKLHIALYWVIVAVITLATTAGAVLLGLFAAQGKKKLLITMASVYGADWIFVFLKFFLFERDGVLGLLVSAGIHIIISFFIIAAIYQYYNVINIEKRFKNIPTVAEKKAKEENKTQENEEKENEHKS